MYRAPILSALCIAALGAADDEMQLADLRLSIGSAPLPNQATGYFSSVQTPSPPALAVGSPTETRYGTSSGVGATATATYGTLAPVGVIWGGGLRYVNGKVPFESWHLPATPGYPNGGIYDQSALKASGGHQLDMSYSSTGAMVEVGAGVRMGPEWHAELAALGSIDWATMQFLARDQSTNQLTSRVTGRGLGFTYGLRLGFYWTSETQWQFGFGGAWTRSRDMMQVDYIDATAHYDLTAMGFSGYGSLGYRF